MFEKLLQLLLYFVPEGEIRKLKDGQSWKLLDPRDKCYVIIQHLATTEPTMFLKLRISIARHFLFEVNETKNSSITRVRIFDYDRTRAIMILYVTKTEVLNLETQFFHRISNPI